MGAWRHSAHDETQRASFKKKDIKQYNQPLYFSSVTWIWSFRPRAVLSSADMLFPSGLWMENRSPHETAKEAVATELGNFIFLVKSAFTVPHEVYSFLMRCEVINDWLQTFGVQDITVVQEGEGEGRGRTNSCRISISWHNLARTRNDKTHDKTLSFFVCFFKVRISFTVVVLFCIFRSRSNNHSTKTIPSPVRKARSTNRLNNPQKKVFNFLQKKKKNQPFYILLYFMDEICAKNLSDS